MTAETISFPLDPGAAALMTRLHAAGHAAYAVGGCVRDSLLGQTPHDWDLCTSATPEQVLELFGEAHCIPTGLQHGTVTVKHGGELYEITTFRTEGAYSDGRHPDHVAFVPDVKEDLARRDFTINAMAYNAEEGLIDPFGGQSDLAAGIVRAVGEPQRRFEEDALRILRLYRFAARFGFAIDLATGQAARALCRHLDCVSEERIAEELSRLLAAPAPGAYLEAEVLAVIFPELDAAELPESRRILDALEPGMEHVPVRLAALLCPLETLPSRRRRCKSGAQAAQVLQRPDRHGGDAGGGESGASSSDTNRAIPLPAPLPAATGPHPPDGLRKNFRLSFGRNTDSDEAPSGKVWSAHGRAVGCALWGNRAGPGGGVCCASRAGPSVGSGRCLLPDQPAGREWPGPDGRRHPAGAGAAPGAGRSAGTGAHRAAPQ